MQTRFNKGEVKLVLNKPGKEKFDHQYGGVACRQALITNELMTLGYSDSKFFDPDWWYLLWFRRDEVTGENFVVEGIPERWCASGIEKWDYWEKLAELEASLFTHSGRINESELIEMLQVELNGLNPEYTNFKITGEVTEAYLEVTYTHNGLRYAGLIIWENCD